MDTAKYLDRKGKVICGLDPAEAAQLIDELMAAQISGEIDVVGPGHLAQLLGRDQHLHGADGLLGMVREVHRVVREELEGTLKELLTVNDQARSTAVHEARKHLKKVRALIRLLLPGDG